MRFFRLIRSLAVSVALVCTIPVFSMAQDSSEDGKSFIENSLQDLLSGAGRSVTVTGFEGALSSNARLQEMSIADEDGVWLTLRDASLIWSRTALLAGRLEITELSATEIELVRLPVAEEKLGTEDAEAWQFALPELPVSINIDALRIEEVLLGEAVLGDPATLSVQGQFNLGEGQGAAQLAINRLDRDDSLTFAGAFSNETRILTLALEFIEAREGLVGTLIGIPDAPALRFKVTGEAPVSEFEAEVMLASDGTERFGGTVRLAPQEQDGVTIQTFAADLSGDVRLLFAPDLRPFFGPSSELNVKGMSAPNGALTLEQLSLRSAALDLEGQVSISAAGMPEAFDLQGRVGGDGTTTLPLNGPKATVQSLSLNATYDAREGDAWRSEISLVDFARDGVEIKQAQISARGTIAQTTPQNVQADVSLGLTDFSHPDAALLEAVGQNPNGHIQLNWTSGRPLDIRSLRVQSGDMSLTARGQLDGLADGFPVSGQADVQVADLTRFAALLQRELSGAADASLSGDGTLLGGSFDLELQARTTDLKVGELRLDPVLAGVAALDISAVRGMEGTALRSLTIDSPAIDASASGQLASDTAELSLEAKLSDVGLVEPRLTGPAELKTDLSWQAGGALTLTNLRAQAVDAILTATGTLEPETPGLPASGRLTLEAQDLSKLAVLAGRPLAGQVSLALEGEGVVQGRDFEAKLDLDGRNLRTGIAQLDQLLSGQIAMQAAAALRGSMPDLRLFSLVTPNLNVKANGSGPGGPVDLSARLANLGILAPGFNGPASVTGTVKVPDTNAERIDLAVAMSGPAGTTARVEGALLDLARSAQLGITGAVPLGLVNGFISPRSVDGRAEFDLRLDGPLGLPALSGRANFSNARLVLPNLKTSLSQLTGQVDLVNSRATLQMSGTAGSGGQFRVGGPIGLSAPFPADLTVTLADLGLSDPNLFETSLSGAVTVVGPLKGGARIGGLIDLGTTEVRVPSGASGGGGAALDITHINEPAAVTRTRRNAGLIKDETESGPAASYPLDLTIRAPNQIFVRGRGLDAELGGQLRLGGTTNSVSASGVFELIRGRLDILGRRLNLTEALIDMRGALDPFLRVVAESDAGDVTARVIIEGPVSEPEVRFASDPDLPQEDVVAQLLFGRGVDQISPFQAAQLVSAAATLAGQRSGGLISSFRSSLGLSDLDVVTTEDGGTELRAGTYISDNIYSEFSTDSEGNQEINLNLDVTRNIILRGGASTEGEAGLGVFFEKDY